jgi:hypothetical protein
VSTNLIHELYLDYRRCTVAERQLLENLMEYIKKIYHPGKQQDFILTSGDRCLQAFRYIPAYGAQSERLCMVVDIKAPIVLRVEDLP